MTRNKLPDEKRRDRRIVAYVTRAEENAIGHLIELQFYQSLSCALRAGAMMLVEAHEKSAYPAAIPLDKTL